MISITEGVKRIFRTIKDIFRLFLGINDEYYDFENHK